MEKEICIIPESGREYIVHVFIPETMKAEEEQWGYICHWIDCNLIGVREWK